MVRVFTPHMTSLASHASDSCPACIRVPPSSPPLSPSPPYPPFQPPPQSFPLPVLPQSWTPTLVMRGLPGVQEAGRLLRLPSKVAQLLFPEVPSPQPGKGAKPVTGAFQVLDPRGAAWQMTYTNRRYSVGWGSPYRMHLALARACWRGVCC